MARQRQLKRIDISNVPELIRLVDEVCSVDEPRILRQNDRDVATVRPQMRETKRGIRGRVLAREDSPFKLVGIGESAIEGGVSGEKHEHLLESCRRNHA